MSEQPDRLAPELELRLALYRMRVARQRMIHARLKATMEMQRQRDEHKRRMLTEMMQKHERLDA